MKNITLIFTLLFSFIVGSSQDQPSKLVKVHLPKFYNYKAGSVYKGKPAPINVNSNSQSKLFRTALRTGYKKQGLNFAGHYCFVYWGCGSPCKQSSIIDLQTGKVYDAPTSGYGFDFRKNSRMMIVNPPDGNLAVNVFGSDMPEIWILNEQSKKFEKQKIKYSFVANVNAGK